MLKVDYTFADFDRIPGMKRCTTKQLGDAGEMLVAAELTLAGVPALKVPDNWPGYDVIAQPADGGPAQRISVKSRTFKRGSNFVEYNANDEFDWLAIVLLPGENEPRRRIFIVPRAVAEARAKKWGPQTKLPSGRYWKQEAVAAVLGEFEDNFCLSIIGKATDYAA